MASLNFDATELKIFYGNLGSPSNHILVKTLDIFYKISDKSQNVHTADLGYLGFQDYHKKIFSSVASKLREATPPVTSMQPLYTFTPLLQYSICKPVLSSSS